MSKQSGDRAQDYASADRHPTSHAHILRHVHVLHTSYLGKLASSRLDTRGTHVEPLADHIIPRPKSACCGYHNYSHVRYTVMLVCISLISFLLQGFLCYMYAYLHWLSGKARTHRSYCILGAGIIILQMSKVDPTTLKKLDRRSTILLEASHHNTELGEKSLSGLEDPGMDALRGTFGAVGSIVRARSARRMSKMSNTTAGSVGHGPRHGGSGQQLLSAHGMEGLPRHQLYDAPVPKAHPPLPEDAGERISMFSQMAQPGTPTLGATPGVPNSPNANRKRIQSIKFEQKDVAHYYPSPGIHQGVRHEEHPSHLPPIPASESSASVENNPFSPVDEESASSFPPPRHRSSTSGSTIGPHPTQSPLYGSAYMDPFSDDQRTVTSPKGMHPSSTLSTLGSQDTRDPLSSFESDPEERQKSIEQGFRKTARAGGGKYPSPADQGVYKDEVRSLVHGRTDSEESTAGAAAGVRSGGIRLLPTQPRRF